MMFTTIATQKLPPETESQELFILSDKKKERFDKIISLIKEKGLDVLYDDPSLVLEDKDYYLSIQEILELASYDQNIKINPTHHHHQKEIIPKKHLTIDVRDLSSHTPPDVKEANGSNMEYLVNAEFQSWEFTINNRPRLTFVPKSIEGLKNLVKWANDNNVRLRAAGYRHTSSNMYAQDDQVLVSMLDIKTVTELPAKYPPIDPYSDLQGIRLIGQPYEKDGSTKIRCSIGAQTCNYHFQDWVHAMNGGNSEYCMPLNVIMVEISFGGSNAMMCHGAGIKNKTISDLVTEIKFINVRGEEQIVNDKELIKAAAGCFGLLGIVTSLTLELNKMTYANFKTVQKDLIVLSIPPHDREISPQLKRNLSLENLNALSDANRCNQAFQRFVSLCETSYYTEFFWFPLHDQGWINCWKDDGDKSKSVRYPDKITTDIQRAGSYLAYLADNALGDNTPPLIKKIQTKLFSSIAMSMLSDKQEIVCSMEDAIHFRKGIQNFRTRMVEIEIPIPNLSNGEPDWSICQKAWWAVIESVYSDFNMEHFPMRTSLEMRIMGGSDITMAAQKGYERTCSIEILTPIAINKAIWDAFEQEVIDKWALLTDENGKYLNIRPHWAKAFDDLFINRPLSWLNELDEIQKMTLAKYIDKTKNKISIPMSDYLKHVAYKNEIPIFMNQMRSICEQGGYQLEDIFKRFSNPLLDNLMTDMKFSLVPKIYQNQQANLLFKQPKSETETTNPNPSQNPTNKTLGKFT